MFKRLLIVLLFPFVALAQYNVQTLNSSTFMSLQTKHNYQTYFNITLVTNVSSTSIDNAPAGSRADFNLCQDATGGRTWSWPSTFTGTSSITVSTTASACTQAGFITPDGLIWNNAAVGGGGASGSIATTIDVTTFGVKADGKVCFDGTVTNGSPNISSAGQCQWTSGDVGKKVFVTNICNGSQCGFGNQATSTAILPSTQVTVARIASVTDATHIVADCNAPGNCASPNASATNTGNATIVYGDDDTAALNTAFASMATATNNVTSGCPIIQLPKGIMFFNKPIFNVLPAGVNNACSGQDVAHFHTMGQASTFNGGGGFVVSGYGQNATTLTPTPDFTNPLSSTNCVGVGENSTWQNLQINGFGQSLLGAGFSPCTNLFGGLAVNLFNANLEGWGSRTASSNGFSNAGGGFSHLINSEVYGFGGNAACTVGGDSNSFINATCGLASGASSGSMLSLTGGARLTSSSSTFALSNPANAPQIDISGTWISNGDILFGGTINTAPSDDIRIESGGVAVITGMNSTSITNSNGINVLAGGKLTISGYRVSGAQTKSLTCAGICIDLGGNSFNGPVAVASGGSYIADGHSVSGACTGVATASQTLGLYGTGPNVTLSTCTSTTIGTGIVMQRVGTLQNLTATATAAGTNASSGVVTVLKNGASQTITCTIGTGTFCNDGTHTVAYVAGDLISLQFTTQAADTLAGVKAFVVEY